MGSLRSFSRLISRYETLTLVTFVHGLVECEANDLAAEVEAILEADHRVVAEVVVAEVGFDRERGELLLEERRCA